MGLDAIRAVLGGRSGRGEYWLSILALFILNVVLTLTLRDPILVSLISTPVWLVIAARRLHDLGRSGWWGLIPFGVGLVLGFSTSLGASISPMATLLINGLVSLGMAIALGTVPGTMDVNRFGARVGKTS